MLSKLRFRAIKQWFKLHERQLSAGALLVGFIIDNLTLRRIDLLAENVILVSYLLLAGLGILVINLYEAKVLRGRLFEWLRLWAPVVMQFAFGALFSGFIVFYSRSASLWASWPFLLLLAAILVGNEAFRKFYVRLTFQASIFYLALFSLAIYQVPILVDRIGASIFLLSGLVSLALIALFLYLLSFLIPEQIAQSRKALAWSIGGIFLAINFFYFTNILPPIPLSLKEAGAYHHVEKVGNGFLAQEEVEVWYRAWWPFETIHLRPGDPVYVYSAVFAPTKINTNIVHHWQYYDEAQSKWVSLNKINFSIAGGRDGGYRSYSMKSAVEPGLWRVDIETSRGQVIGRAKFRVERVSASPAMKARLL